MPHYHFNIRNGLGFTADEEGLDLGSEEDARAHAIRGARSLMSAEMLDGRLDLDGQIEVTDDLDGAILTVRFRDAVQIDPGAAAANR